MKCQLIEDDSKFIECQMTLVKSYLEAFLGDSYHSLPEASPPRRRLGDKAPGHRPWNVAQECMERFGIVTEDDLRC